MGVKAYIGVGSNIMPEATIRKALFLLKKSVTVTALSTCYKTPPLGNRNIPGFINCVWEIDTDIRASELKHNVLAKIESECGRQKSADKYGSRTIDLDLLLYGTTVLQNQDITIPQPDIRERPFVAIPLFEIAPDFVLPDTGETLEAITAPMKRDGLIPDVHLTKLLRKELKEPTDG